MSSLYSANLFWQVMVHNTRIMFHSHEKLFSKFKKDFDIVRGAAPLQANLKKWKYFNVIPNLIF